MWVGDEEGRRCKSVAGPPPLSVRRSNILPLQCCGKAFDVVTSRKPEDLPADFLFATPAPGWRTGMGHSAHRRGPGRHFDRGESAR